MVTLEVWRGGCRRSLVSYLYREYTGGVSGLAPINSQKERLARAICFWRGLDLSRRDLLIMGDVNLDYYNWSNSSYPPNDLVDMVKLSPYLI